MYFTLRIPQSLFSDVGALRLNQGVVGSVGNFSKDS